MHLTADQQVRLSVNGQDKYGNPVAIGGDTRWESSDELILQVIWDPDGDPAIAVATAVGPVGTAVVTCTNDTNFMGSLAVNVVADDIAEIEIAAGIPESKAEPTQ